jgi:replicative DNA helicase
MGPHDEEAERAVLGALLLDNSKLGLIENAVTGADFYRPGHARIFEAIRMLIAEGAPADEVTVAGKAQDPGAMAYLVELSGNTPTAANITTYARTVREKSLSRKLMAIGHELQTLAQTEAPKAAIEHTSKRLYELSNAHQDRRIVTAIDAARMAMRRIERAMRNPEDVSGVRTGFVDLDELLGGYQAGDFIVIAARPAMGKTALVLNQLEGATVRYSKRAALFELEMSAEQLGMRGIAAAGRVSMQRLKRGALGETDFARLMRGVTDFGQSKLVIDETPTATLADIRTVCRRMKLDGGLDLIAIDYLQLLRPEKDRHNRENEVAEISRGLKQIAKELGVPVIALSQLNRDVEKRADKRPMTADLRESGAIEQDADVIMFLYRDEVYDPDTEEKGIAEIIVAKQRNGPTGTVKLRFDPDLQRFDNLEGRHQ